MLEVHQTLTGPWTHDEELDRAAAHFSYLTLIDEQQGCDQRTSLTRHSRSRVS